MRTCDCCTSQSVGVHEGYKLDDVHSDCGNWWVASSGLEVPGWTEVAQGNGCGGVVMTMREVCLSAGLSQCHSQAPSFGALGVLSNVAGSSQMTIPRNSLWCARLHPKPCNSNLVLHLR